MSSQDMSDSYRRVGRGGAGNYMSEKELAAAQKRISADIEAQNIPLPSPDHSPTIHSTSPTTSALHKAAHMGRGGAGNTFSPAVLPQKGDFTKQVDGTIPMTAQINISKGHVGRGGVGNFHSGEATRKNAEVIDVQERERREAELRRDIEGQVEQGLGKPERTYGGL